MAGSSPLTWGMPSRWQSRRTCCLSGFVAFLGFPAPVSVGVSQEEGVLPESLKVMTIEFPFSKLSSVRLS